MYKVEFAKGLEKVLKKYKKSNPNAFAKLIRLIPELEAHPRIGTAHPEPLIQGSSVTYSRRLNAHDRVIYDIYDDRVVVLIIAVEGHYSDK
ncbi:MAG: type II toxin-antitoxin system YoeB family toxin [Bacteroidales bacterium]|nr:type II toxin-antitoxin system YoeB family toxin [Bacteroidales bacterium]